MSINDIAGQLVTAIAEKEGVQVDAGMVVTFAEQAAAMVADLVTGSAKKKAAADADAAAEKIKTLDDAEAFEKRPK